MLKRIVGLVVGTTVACSSFMAFAAPVVTTRSMYGTDGKITVTNDITGVEAGQTLTYLAWDNGVELANLQGTNIVYIDQFEAVATTYSFDYTADVADINASVKVGGDAGVSSVGNIAGPGCVVTGDVTGKVAYGTTGFVSFECVDAANVTGVTVGDVPVAYGDVWIQGSGSILIDASVFANLNTANVTLTKAAVDEVAAIATTNGIASVVTADGRSVIVVGTIEGASADYGVYIQVGENKAIKCKALGKGSNGMYAIQLTGLEENDEITAWTYAGESVGKKCAVTLTGAKNAAGSFIE